MKCAQIAVQYALIRQFALTVVTIIFLLQIILVKNAHNIALVDALILLVTFVAKDIILILKAIASHAMRTAHYAIILRIAITVMMDFILIQMEIVRFALLIVLIVMILIHALYAMIAIILMLIINAIFVIALAIAP